MSHFVMLFSLRWENIFFFFLILIFLSFDKKKKIENELVSIKKVEK